MSEMVDRVAEAMWQGEWARAGNGGMRRVPWSEVAPLDQAHYCFVARAAIEAMRVPTTEMGNAAVSDYNDHNAFDIADACDAWQAMIDEALK